MMASIFERHFAAVHESESGPIATRRIRTGERRFRCKAEMALSSLPCAASRRPFEARIGALHGVGCNLEC
jgi:hypothetical protein